MHLAPQEEHYRSCHFHHEQSIYQQVNPIHEICPVNNSVREVESKRKQNFLSCLQLPTTSRVSDVAAQDQVSILD